MIVDKSIITKCKKTTPKGLFISF